MNNQYDRPDAVASRQVGSCTILHRASTRTTFDSHHVGGAS